MLFLCESPKVCLYHRCSPKGLIFQHSEAVIKLHQQPGSGGHLLTGSGVWRGGLVELPGHSLRPDTSALQGQQSPGSPSIPGLAGESFPPCTAQSAGHPLSDKIMVSEYLWLLNSF